MHYNSQKPDVKELCNFGLQKVRGQLSFKQGFPSDSLQKDSKSMFKMAATGPWKSEAQPLSIGLSSRSIKNHTTQGLFTNETEVS